MYALLSLLASIVFVIYIMPTTGAGIVFLFVVTWIAFFALRATLRGIRSVFRVVTALQA